MKTLVKKIEMETPDNSNICITVIFTDDDRNFLIRSCEAKIFLDKKSIETATLDEIKNLAIDQAHNLISDASACRNC
jgi:hypothetical protein